MDYKELKILIDKYMDGQTSLEEEGRLREYFRECRSEKGGDKVGEFGELAYLFDFFDEEREIEAKSYTAESVKNRKNRFVSLKWLYSFGAAASLLGLLYLGNVFVDKSDVKVYAYVNGVAVTDEYTAMQEAKKALTEISDRYNDATHDLKYFQVFDKVTKLVTKKY